jgi:hypothetical protein
MLQLLHYTSWSQIHLQLELVGTRTLVLHFSLQAFGLGSAEFSDCSLFFCSHSSLQLSGFRRCPLFTLSSPDLFLFCLFLLISCSL